MKIMPNVLDRQFFMHQDAYEKKAIEVLRSGWYILGDEVKKFEEEFAEYIGSNYCIGLASGLDALWMAFRILEIGQGDEVIVQGNAYIACVMGITMNGATPIFVEPDEYNNIDTTKIEERITEKTKAILVIHLYGQASSMADILELAHKYKLKIVEDCAQSHGAKFKDKMTGTFGDIGCFSFYPSKNLGCFGDGGAIVTDNEEIAQKFRIYRNYGSEKRYHNMVVGTNSRLDELQAGLLRVKLNYLQQYNNEREKLCNRYLSEIKNKSIVLPRVLEGASTVWHQFVIRTKYRDELIEFLNKKEVYTLIHYPIPPHLSEAYQYLNIKEGSLPITERFASEVLSLPLYNGMLDEEQSWVIQCMNEFEVS